MKTLALAAIAGLTIFGAAQAHAADPIQTGTFSNTAISGYDTVSYFTEGKPMKGSSEFTTNYKGAKWQFSSAANLTKFKANPEQYAPQYGGYCAYAAAKNYLASVDPEIWNIVDGKLYLNYNADVKEKWVQNPQEFITQADINFPELIK